MKVKDVICCSFPNWYEKFKKLTIPSIILPIPSEVLSYLQENGTLVLPEGSYGKESNYEDSSEAWEEDSKESDVALAPNLDEFNQKIRQAIKKLGGEVFPKLNWSSPKDASWISFNKSLQCLSPGDVYLLLKSSDFVSHDLTSPFKDMTPYEVQNKNGKPTGVTKLLNSSSDVPELPLHSGRAGVSSFLKSFQHQLEDCVDKCEVEEKVDYCVALRKWIEVNPSDEFRCFVKDRELVGISQRDISQYYSSIHKEKDCILDDIFSFWEENIRNYFPLFSYVFDVHRPKDGHVTLLDFGPYGATTDSLMFSWEELSSDQDEAELSIIANGVDSNRVVEEDQSGHLEPEFRYITNATGVQPSPYMRYGLPLDIVDLSTGEDPTKLTDFLRMKLQNENDSSSSSEDEDCPDNESSLSSPSNSSL